MRPVSTAPLKLIDRFSYIIGLIYSNSSYSVSLQCFDAVGWAAGRASGL